eukprot:1896628-Amphidinium_carterae.1
MKLLLTHNLQHVCMHSVHGSNKWGAIGRNLVNPLHHLVFQRVNTCSRLDTGALISSSNNYAIQGGGCKASTIPACGHAYLLVDGRDIVAGLVMYSNDRNAVWGLGVLLGKVHLATHQTTKFCHEMRHSTFQGTSEDSWKLHESETATTHNFPLWAAGASQTHP